MTHPVITVTLNPAIDRTVWVDELIPGATHRTSDTRASFGGKGINVARVVARIGGTAIALGLAGEDQAGAMEHHLESLGVDARFIRVPGETRTNLKVVEQANGRLTEINGSGPPVAHHLVEALEVQLLSAMTAEAATTVVLAGSLPMGVGPDIYARWTRILHRTRPDVRVLVDTSDEALQLVTHAAPFFLKPNRVEAEEITGHLIEGTQDAADAARDIARRGPRCVLLSLGSRGAVAVWGDQAETIEARPIQGSAGQLQTTVGAGDAMVARVAVELARIEGGDIGPEQFFAISRLAVAEAERQISASAPEWQTQASLEPTPASTQPASAS